MEEIFSKSYDKNEFIKFYKPFKDLRSALEDLAKEPNNIDAREDIGSILWDDAGKYAGMNADIPIKEAKGSLDERVNQLAGKIDEKARIIDGYVGKNLDAFLSKLEARDLYQIALRNQPCKNGNSEHDKKVELQLELAGMQGIAKNDDLNSMIRYIAGKLQNDAGLLNAFLGYSAGDSDYVRKTFNNYMEQKQRELQKMFVGNGEISKSILASYIKNNLDEIKRQANKETNFGDKGDLYDLVKPAYLEIAKAVYSKEKSEKEKDEDPARESRRAKRQELGLPL